MEKLTLAIDPSVSEFLKNVTPELEHKPAIHSQLLSLAARYQELGKPTHLLARGIDSQGQLLIAGLQTESFRAMMISQASPETSRLFAESLYQQSATLPGILGPTPGVDAFAETWRSLRGSKSELVVNLRLFELSSVKPPRPAPGRWRFVQPSDEKLVFQWLREFHAEATPFDPLLPGEELMKAVRNGTQAQQYFIWEESGKPVCLVGSRRETTRERWIAPVYTPKHLRGRGFASSLVAAVSQRIVESGKKGMLFTDLANPTSNSIYQAVGYEPLADFRQLIFK